MAASSKNEPVRLARLERNLAAGLTVLVVALVATFLAQRATVRAERLTGLYDRIVFSTSSFTNPQTQEAAVFDRDLSQAWSDRGLPAGPGRYQLPRRMRSALPDPRSLYLTVEVGLTHFPDRPPAPNPLRELIIWAGAPGDQFRDYARPKRVHLLFFRQALVDTDRLYAFPGQPIFLVGATVDLSDSLEPQRIPLDFVPAPPDSRAFPINVSQTWARLIVESYYPGARHHDLTAIRELHFVETHATTPPPVAEAGRRLLRPTALRR